MSTVILQYMIPSMAMSSGQYGTSLVTDRCICETFKTTSVAVYFNCDKRATSGSADRIQLVIYPIIGELDDNDYLENITDIPQEYKYKMDIVNTAKEEDIVKIINICFEDIASNIGSTTPAVLMLRSIAKDENKDSTKPYLARLWKGKELVKEILSINEEIKKPILCKILPNGVSKVEHYNNLNKTILEYFNKTLGNNYSIYIPQWMTPVVSLADAINFTSSSIDEEHLYSSSYLFGYVRLLDGFNIPIYVLGSLKDSEIVIGKTFNKNGEAIIEEIEVKKS